ncbi:VP7 [Banna-like virus strain Balaton/2010/HUN]|nr:VP7 [Banna-like virus strain Balaton/2010/HUN]
MEIVRTKSQSAAITVGISQFFDLTQNRAVIETYSEFRKRNAFILKYAEQLFTGLPSLFKDELDGLKQIIESEGGANSFAKITQVGLSHMTQFLLSAKLPADDYLARALRFIVFQIHSNELRKGGALLMFDNLLAYLKKHERTNKQSLISYVTKDDVDIIIVNGKTLTYVCRNADALKTKEYANAEGHFVITDTIGSFRASSSGMDAVTFMTLKSEAEHIINLFGNAISIGQLYYRQLHAEVSTLAKLKANPGKVHRMHGNVRDGFVRRLNDSTKHRVTGAQRALDHSNIIRFKSSGAGKDERLTYLVDECFLKSMLPDNRACARIDNINALIASKLLHDCKIGTACMHCGVIGSMDTVSQLSERGVDIVANTNETLDAMAAPVMTKPEAETVTDASLNARIVQSKGQSYVPKTEYKAKKSEPADSGFTVKVESNHSVTDALVAGVVSREKLNF